MAYGSNSDSSWLERREWSLRSAARGAPAIPRSMKLNGLVFLAELADYPANSFERRFAKISTRLGLGARMTREDLTKLFDAAFYACLCNISFNGLGGCEGEIRLENELNRIRLEQQFMHMRKEFFRTAGWQRLVPSKQKQLEKTFLEVAVADENLAQ